MNKKIAIGIVSGIVLLIIVMGVLFKVFFQNGVEVRGKRDLENINKPKFVERDKTKVYRPTGEKLIVFEYVNYAWGYSQYGEIITTTGERYTYSCTEEDYEAHSDDIMSCITSALSDIGDEDLNKLLNLEDKISDDVSQNNIAMDYGQVSIEYHGEKMYTLDGYGDVEVINKSSGAKEALRILKKYNIYI